MKEAIIQNVGMVAAVILPMFNIPLIYRIFQRKSSKDISLTWALGVWVCILLMAPSGFASEDVIWRTFNYINIVLFSCVVVVTLKFRNGKNDG